MSKKNKEAAEPAENIEETAGQAESEHTQPESSEPEQTESEQKVESETEKLKAELEAKNDAFLRLAAEYDNFRKRTQNEKLALYDDATAKAVAEILPIADSLDMAIQNSKDAPEQFLKGLEMVRSQFTASLAKLKVESFAEIGEEFDPVLHNAISKIESEEFGENCISQVFQKGYRISGKVIRHAMVQVANCG